MQCNQLNRLIKEWFIHVKNETMAPGRMMQFVDQHVKECEKCRSDQELSREIEKIREFILPESKLPKSFRSPNKTLTPEISPVIDDVLPTEEQPSGDALVIDKKTAGTDKS